MIQIMFLTALTVYAGQCYDFVQLDISFGLILDHNLIW